MATRTSLKVFYDGSCPLCIREIEFYRRQSGASCIAWVDVSRMIDGEVSPGLSKTQALSRFYTLDENGDLASGGKAFTRIWEILPRFRPLAALFRIQPFAWLLDCAYSFFLKFRPSLQTMVQNRQTRCEQMVTHKTRAHPSRRA